MNGSRQVVVIPKITGVMLSGRGPDADGRYRVWVFTGQNAESDADFSFVYNTEAERDSSYRSLMDAIRLWWEE